MCRRASENSPLVKPWIRWATEGHSCQLRTGSQNRLCLVWRVLISATTSLWTHCTHLLMDASTMITDFLNMTMSSMYLNDIQSQHNSVQWSTFGMCSQQFCSNYSILSWQHGPKPLSNVSKTLLNLCHEDVQASVAFGFIFPPWREIPPWPDSIWRQHNPSIIKLIYGMDITLIYIKPKA